MTILLNREQMEKAMLMYIDSTGICTIDYDAKISVGREQATVELKKILLTEINYDDKFLAPEECTKIKNDFGDFEAGSDNPLD